LHGPKWAIASKGGLDLVKHTRVDIVVISLW